MSKSMWNDPMKIVIRKQGGIGFPIYFPTWVLTKTSIIRKICNDHMEMDLDEEVISQFAKELKRCKKNFGKLEFVSVESADGMIVKIYL